MGAAVRIEANAFSDERFELLGELAGYNRHEALGRIARLWSYCTDKETAVVDATIVRAYLGPNGPDAIVGAGLADVVEGGIKIRGSERIGWLKQKRENARKGGKQAAAKKQAKAQAAAKQTGSYSSDVAQANGRPLTLAPATGSSNQSSPCSPPGDKREAAPKPKAKRKHALPPDWKPNAKHEQLARELRLDLGQQAAKMRDWAEAGDERCVNWDARFRGWLRRAVEFQAKARGSPPAQTAIDRQLERVRMFEELEQRGET